MGRVGKSGGVADWNSQTYTTVGPCSHQSALLPYTHFSILLFEMSCSVFDESVLSSVVSFEFDNPPVLRLWFSLFINTSKELSILITSGWFNFKDRCFIYKTGFRKDKRLMNLSYITEYSL